MSTVARTLLIFASVGAFVAPAQAGSLEVIGYAGVLGEWELTAAVAEGDAGGPGEYAGRVTMKHVGACTRDGPEEKTGDMRFRLSTPPSRMDATLVIAGVECTFRGKLSDSYTGVMRCPGRPSVPLAIWVK